MKLIDFGWRTGHGPDEGVLTRTAGIRTNNPVLKFLCGLYLRMLGFKEKEGK
jgi:hypothetical protein